MAIDLKDKILVADDEELNLILLTRMLERNGFDVLCVRDGEQVLESVQASPHPPLCILMDLMMPTLSGWEATALLKQNIKTKNIPIIATTALTKNEALEVDHGFDGYCVKPIREAVLLNIIQVCVNA